MAFCTICFDVLQEEEASFILDMCSEILFHIEDQLNREITNDDRICQTCLSKCIENASNTFEIKTEHLESSESANDIKDEIEQQDNDIKNEIGHQDDDIENKLEPINYTALKKIHKSQRKARVKMVIKNDLSFLNRHCILCYASYVFKRSHSLPNCPQRDEIQRRIAPKNIVEGSRICLNCWQKCSKAIGVSIKQIRSHLDFCVNCKCSIVAKRSYILFEGPQQDGIQLAIAPRQVQPGDRVCTACWYSSTKKQIGTDDQCVVCSVTIEKKKIISNTIKNIIAERIRPRELTDQSALCYGCWSSAINTVKLNQSTLESNSPLERNIRLTTYKRVASSTSSCFVSDCKNPERLVVPQKIKYLLLSKYFVYIGRARVCAFHKTATNWDEILKGQYYLDLFNREEIENIVELNLIINDMVQLGQM